MKENAREWILVNKGFSPAHFISPCGTLLLISEEKWENGELKERTARIVELKNKK